MKLRRIGPSAESQTLTVPSYPELDTETCRAILPQAAHHVAIAQLGPHFRSG
jgi:hypothetical protein